MEKQYSLVEFTKEEGAIVLKKLQDFLNENSIDIKANSFIDPEGKISSKSIILKKVELVPKVPDSPTGDTNEQK